MAFDISSSISCLSALWALWMTLGPFLVLLLVDVFLLILLLGLIVFLKKLVIRIDL